MNLGVGLGDTRALVQHGRAFGIWLRTKQNDEDLFESMSEVYGEVLRRRGLVDTTLMANRWAQQMHFYYQGYAVHETLTCKNRLKSSRWDLSAGSWSLWSRLWTHVSHDMVFYRYSSKFPSKF